MPKPTLQNRSNFKTYLRYYKSKFANTVIPFFFLDEIVTEVSVGISTADDVRVVLFDNFEEVDITESVNNEELIYVPALYGDTINFRIGSSTYELKFFEESGVQFEGTNYYLDDVIDVGNKRLIIKGLGGALLATADGPSYQITQSSTSINEGDSVTFTVNTENILPGTTLYYSTGGSMSASDFTNNSLTGSFNIVSTGPTTGIGTVIRTVTSDFVSEGTESFTFVVRTGSSSGSIVGTSATVRVANLVPTCTITPSTTNTSEGNSVAFVINTTNIPNGTTLYYTTNGNMSASDFADNSLSGSFAVTGIGGNSGIATVTRVIVNDFENTEGTESFSLSIRTNSISGGIVTTSATVNVADVILNYVITPSTVTLNEGQSVVFTVNTLNVGSGTTLYYTIDGNINSNDFTDDLLSGSFNIVTIGSGIGTATITKTIKNDFEYENTESFTVSVRRNSITGPIVATTPTISVANVVPTYSLTASTNSVNEGSSVTFTVNGSDVPNGTLLYYTIAGITTSADFTDNAISGSFAINNGVGSVTKTISSDRRTEGREEFYFQVRRNSITSPIVISSDVITINDTSIDVGSIANGLTYGPVQVNRDNGNPALASDWYKICNIDNIPDGSKVAIYIDNSGSMTSATVKASYDLLLSKLAARNISVITVTNPNEDWITPFLTDLS